MTDKTAPNTTEPNADEAKAPQSQSTEGDASSSAAFDTPRTLTSYLPDLAEVPESELDEVILESFQHWVSSRGLKLYPAQEEAALSLAAGNHVILATPTGTGKSMVAIAAHFIAMAHGKRSYYTAPIKALVNEKFFALCEIFGPEYVGMATGDAAVNSHAPIVCATAEVVANIALRSGDLADIDQVVMDEFHYYSDPERGWAWQVPLLELPKAQMLLMSATLGNTDFLVADLAERTGRAVDVVDGATRPVPLEFSYVHTPVHETIDELIKANKAPVYVVHFSQRAAAERAQSLTSSTFVTKEEKEQIAKEIGDFRFTSLFGKTLSGLLRRGIGIHHAGMLPKYRRLVERLAQTGLLKVICGTDTLGVGINVPIRTVLFTQLNKFDGTNRRLVNSREFHQIAGRAGRAGFDTVGYVVIEAPEYEIENYALRKRAGGDEKKLKKLRLKKAPAGEPTWTEKTYERLIDAPPEPMKSQFSTSHSMLINMLARPRDGYQHLEGILRGSHNPRSQQNADILRTLELLNGLVRAGIVVREPEGTDPAGRVYHLTAELDTHFALNQPLAPFALAALELLDKGSDTFAFDVISVFESIVENPGPLLAAQQSAARAEEIAHLKAEGVDFHDRQALVEEITYPQPLKDLILEAYEVYAQGHPWVRAHEPQPKSVVREMLEKAMTFSDLISTYQIARSEGVVLRYLTDMWRTLEHTLPPAYRTDEVDDIIIWLGELVRQVDSSLLDEWLYMQDPDAPISQETLEQELAFSNGAAPKLTANERAFTVMVRNLFFKIVTLFANEDEAALEEIADATGNLFDPVAALDEYFGEYDDLDDGPAARGNEYFVLRKEAKTWQVRQILKDPAGDNAFAFVGTVDLAESDEAGDVVISELRFEG